MSKFETTEDIVKRGRRFINYLFAIGNDGEAAKPLAEALDEIEKLRHELHLARQWDEYHPAYLAGARAAFWMRDKPSPTGTPTPTETC